MKRTITVLIIAAASLGVALIATGCGSSASGSSDVGAYGSGATSGPTTDGTGAATVAVASSLLGRILVDGGGRTLYLFEKDTSGTSTCDGACAAIWPPLTTKGGPVAGDGAVAAKLGTTERTDGKTEVTYNGHPLYYYAGDT